MADWDKHIDQHVQLGEKVIQVNNCKEEKFTQMMAHPHQELAKKEALAKPFS